MKPITTWSDVTIEKYRQLIQIKDENSTSKMLGILSVLSGMSKRDLMKLKATELEPLIRQFQFTNVPMTNKVTRTFNLGDIKYGLIPDLNSLSIGEIIDLEEYLANWESSIHKLVAILYRPIVKEDLVGYEIEPYDGSRASVWADWFEQELSIEVVYGATLFFSTIASVSWISTMNSSMETTQILNLI